MIEVQTLSRHYGKTAAVDTVSFTIDGRDIVGLLGHNGAGKTTVMKMLSGYLEPSAGSISINGFSMATDARSVQRSLGYLPENLPVYPDMVVADYLDYAATLKGIVHTRRPAAIRRAIESTGLASRMLDRIGDLSRGFKQRVGVAQAILGEPELLILDEPTNGLDPAQTAQMRELIRTLAQRATVILSTHIMQEVDALCGRVLLLSNGQLVLDQRLAELKESNVLRMQAGGEGDRLVALLRQLPQVQEVSPQPADEDRLCLFITLRPDIDHDTAAGNISRVVIESGARLYELTPVLRDLDTVFRELSTQRGATADD